MSETAKGMLGVRMRAEDWDNIITLRHARERATGRPVSVTDVLRDVLATAAQGVQVADRPDNNHRAAAPSPPEESVCLLCCGCETGEQFRCLQCNRLLAKTQTAEGLWLRREIIGRREDGAEFMYGSPAAKVKGPKRGKGR